MKFSLIIPTIGRMPELQRLLDSVRAQTRRPDEIIIVAPNHTVVAAALNSGYADLPLKFIEQTQLCLPIARNLGVVAAVGDIIGFLDDDCVLEQKYTERVVDFFEKNPQALGVQGIITNFIEGHIGKVGGKKLYKLYAMFARLFLLNHASRTNKLLLSGRNQYAATVTNVQPCEWLSGVGNYRRDVFTEFHFDESLGGYALGEDKLFSYPVQEKYTGSLFVDPSIRLAHNHAGSGRPEGKEWVDMKVKNTAYLWHVLLKKKGVLAMFAFWWANCGDILFAVFAAMLGQRPAAFPWWHLTAYWHLLWK